MFRKIGGFFAGYVCLCSAVLTCAAAGDMLAGDEESPGLMAGMMIFFGVITWGSYKLSKSLFADPTNTGDKPLAKKSHEQQILDLAIMSDGTLTIAEIAAHTPLSVAEAKAGIEALTKEGIASVEFDEKQDIYYRFPGLD